MEDKKYILGLDLGMMQDYSALSMIEQVEIVEGGDIAKREMGTYYKVSYNLVHLQRFPLNTQYPEVVNRVKEMLENPDIAHNNHLVLDVTGLGEPVAQMFRAAGVNPVGITLTAGAEVTETSGGYEGYHVPKRQLVSALVVLVQSGRLKIAEGLEHGPAFEEEMQNFHYLLDQKTGHDSYESVKDSVHDDLVISVAMGVCYCVKYERHMAEVITDNYEDDERRNASYDYLTGELR